MGSAQIIIQKISYIFPKQAELKQKKTLKFISYADFFFNQHQYHFS